ncbi:hypothetical protein ABEP01_14965, partial [Geobacillus stearothermophilus]|uniref:hypothetical protein n=1 Tax=Geobacillus stearothermophilus TaxID=1422 RepID=UPI003D215877
IINTRDVVYTSIIRRRRKQIREIYHILACCHHFATSVVTVLSHPKKEKARPQKERTRFGRTFFTFER